MTRAAFLPTPGDPFLNKLWFKMFEKYWQNEVDKLYICLNSAIEPDVVAFLIKTWKANPKVSVIYYDHMLEHGNALTYMIQNATEDLCLLIEDDGFIIKSGVVEEHFNRLEQGQYDLIASQRQSSSLGIAQATMLKFNRPSIEAFFWPNFVFTRRSLFKKTDMNFGSKSFEPGHAVPHLNWVSNEKEVMDTFGWMSIQLLAQNPILLQTEQYHSMNNDLDACAGRFRCWDGQAPWVHWGSLSAMMTNFMYYQDGPMLADRKAPKLQGDIPKPVDFVENPEARKDIECRVAHLMLAWDMTQKECDEISGFRLEYINALNRIVESFGLDHGTIEATKEIYKNLFNL